MMAGETLRREGDRTERRVRFRVASATSGRVLREVFREDGSDDSAGSDTTSSSEPERAVSPVVSEANSHLSGLVGPTSDECAGDPDDLLVYASTKEQVFSSKRVNIFSKNGSVRGVKDKVSAGQVLFNDLCVLYGGSLYGNRQKRPRPSLSKGNFGS
ncbi:glutaredoxin domain-containing cysteine-rich protein 1 [Brachyhypopomus gauderio]|uniref:glutaredoxin domain-containing cysteine-rich protein 1 n=1 Tax=Brachyhypopomus gauderio TaxID=698409 RepID=UPI0040430621